MKAIIVGSGKLASEITNNLKSYIDIPVSTWDCFQKDVEANIVIHAGSGRQLVDCISYCNRSGSILLELSTSSKINEHSCSFPVIICPNTSLLIIKTLYMVKCMGYLFKPYKITILESHQSNKKTIPGTAVHFADSLGVAPKNIISIRDKNTQITEVGIPNDFLDAHAFHKVSISNGDENIVIETTVLGHRSYSQGVAELVKAILNKNLESRKYSILEMMELGLIG